MGAPETAAWVVDETLCSAAVERARSAVGDPCAADHLVRYYDPARTTLSVRVLPLAIRRFLDDNHAQRASELLERLPASARLEDDSAPKLAHQMAEFHNFAKATLGANPWVTASKLCARKRPNLFPVRDRVVLEFLGLTPGYSTDWPAFAAIMRDDVVRERLDRVVSEAISRGADLGDGTLTLRHLDVVLWMAGMKGHPIRGKPSPE